MNAAEMVSAREDERKRRAAEGVLENLKRQFGTEIVSKIGVKVDRLRKEYTEVNDAEIAHCDLTDKNGRRLGLHVVWYYVTPAGCDSPAHEYVELRKPGTLGYLGVRQSALKFGQRLDKALS